MTNNDIVQFFKDNDVFNIKSLSIIEKSNNNTQIFQSNLLGNAFNIFDSLKIRLFSNDNFTLELEHSKIIDEQLIYIFLEKIFSLYGEDSNGISFEQIPLKDTFNYQNYCWYFKESNGEITLEVNESADIYFGINIFIDDQFSCDFSIINAQNVIPPHLIPIVTEKKSPKITGLKWGQIRIGSNNYKDAKCFPGGSTDWNWNKTGTKHYPGVQIEDLQELIDNGSKVIVLSKGFKEKLNVKKDTIDYLENLKIPFFILETGEAAKKYNELAENHLVGGLFHSTC